MLIGRKPTSSEKEWMIYAVQIPCIACSLFHDVHDSPAEYHHMSGKTVDRAHLYGFSLCTRHHRHKDNQKPQRWTSRHGDGLAAFERAYCTELDFLREQQKRVDELKGCIV